MNADRGSPRGWPGAVLRAGFRRLLGVPGAVSLRAFTPAVRAATVGEAAARGREDAGLSAAVRGLSDPLTADAPLLGVALASLREAGRRSLGERATDEQLLACVALASGHAVEMDTGEGKTLAGALAAALLASSGRRVHVLSVNDYLAERDAEWMAPLFALLGIRVAWVGQRHDSGERRAAYRAQVVYAPVSEVGFDVLRDRFAESDAERVLPVRDVALVDEADAVLIDEAAVPLVLAGEAAPPHADHTGTHNPGQAPGTIIDHAEAARLVSTLAPDTDFTVEEDGATVTLTDAGLDRVEAALGGIRLYEPEHVPTLTRVNLALHARTLLTRDVHYLVRDGSVTLVNDARGRLVHRQRWPDGLHAAIEAKERLGVSPSGVVLDSLTVHDLIAEYRSVAGMSGTLVSVARELLELHGLPTARVPRSVPSARIDHPDRVFETAEQLRATLVQDVSRRHASGQPVLIATRSVAESESIAAVLRGAGLTPRVLNARDDAREAALIARAGEPGALTVSTQMSGRGTDIRLGGAEPPS
ncbi:preprotein translocase subunit SecA, partial [Leucobacter sp. M11]|uniref:preprotein translocase subunit SecA n=1 Tax=Leucobacter sp. M11 TaxID=2993565 RepID=UPI002D85DCDB|nr:accessory Sec system translocase SecA2 [Leucobacter sp. M11]